MKSQYVSHLLCSAALAASCSGCTPRQPAPAPSSEAAIALPETQNVSYEGVLSKTASGIFSLQVDALTSVTAEANDPALDLQSYLGQTVVLHGSSRPSSDGLITLRVSSVERLSDSDHSSSTGTVSSEPAVCGGIAGIACQEGFECTDDLSDDCNPADGGADCFGVCVPVHQHSLTSLSSSSSSSSLLMSSSIMSVARSSSSPSKSSSSSLPSSSTSLASSSQATVRKDIELMSQQKYEELLWTQKYCTSHVGFCVPAHKNWYFKSFGATTTTKWHVEFSTSDIEELGQGVILFNLVSGSSENAGGVSGSVKSIGDDAVGYLDWRSDHFEISAHSNLLPAIEYMVKHIVEYVPVQ